MEVIEFTGYIEEEKMSIADRYLIPRQLEENGLEEVGLRFAADAMKKLIREYTYEAGVRNLEREIGKVCRKIARLKAEGRQYPTLITVPMIEKLLGPPQYFQTEAERQDEVGVAAGMAWTENGGEIMFVEIAVLEGKGNLQITGQVGDVMQESAQAAMTYLKSRAASLGIDPDVFERMDVHMHLPETAVPKDGPSAGITMTTALISAFTGRPVYREVAMTGEITLRGRVLPVGGIKEKVLAAYRAGMKAVLIPERNLKDLVEMPKKVMHDLKIIPVTHMDQVLELAVSPDVVIEPPRPRRRPGNDEQSGDAGEYEE
ncbi:MAG: S16 family serine protease [Anaerolineales bacterium]